MVDGNGRGSGGINASGVPLIRHTTVQPSSASRESVCRASSSLTVQRASRLLASVSCANRHCRRCTRKACDKYLYRS